MKDISSTAIHWPFNFNWPIFAQDPSWLFPGEEISHLTVKSVPILFSSSMFHCITVDL